MIHVAYTRLLQLIFLSSIIALALGLNYISASTWTGPSALPPGNNIAASLNIGTTNQVKDANLSVGHSANTATDYGLVSYGKIRSTVGGIEFPDGSVQTSADIPSGMYAPFKGPTCPSGWLPADGTNGTADLRGQFVRGWSNGSTTDSGRVLGSAQGDAIRNITGALASSYNPWNNVVPSGAFTTNSATPNIVSTTNGTGYFFNEVFNASLVVPTANEDRPVNVALLYCYKI